MDINEKINLNNKESVNQRKREESDVNNEREEKKRLK